VASIEEIIGRLQSANAKIGESVQMLSAAENAAGQLQSQMAAAGVQDKVAKFAQVKESIARARQHLQGGTQMVDQSANAAKSAGGPGG
jgi:hypothetical protein